VLGLQDQVRDLSRELTQLRASARDATTLIRDMKDALEELPKDEGNDLIRRAMLWLDPGRARTRESTRFARRWKGSRREPCCTRSLS
jgi:hypothetical protein